MQNRYTLENLIKKNANVLDYDYKPLFLIEAISEVCSISDMRAIAEYCLENIGTTDFNT